MSILHGLSQPKKDHRQVVGLSLILTMSDIEKLRSAIQTLAHTPREHDADLTTLEAQAKPEEQQPDKQRRTICIRFYVTAAEEERLNELTDGIKNRSQWVRSRIFGQTPTRPRPQIPALNREALITLRAVRSKLNQIARAFNTALAKQQPLPLAPETLNCLQAMQTQVATVGQALVELHTVPTREGEEEA